MVNRKKFWFIFWMLVPVFSVIGFLSVYPTIKGFILAFQNYTVFTSIVYALLVGIILLRYSLIPISR